MTRPPLPSMNIELDNTLRPQDDFFHYVNKKWLQAHPIPESETRWGTFSVLRDRSWEALHTIYEDLQTTKPPSGSIQQQARDFYFTGMNFDSLEATHLHDIRELLARIEAIENTTQLAEVIGYLHSFDISGPWHSYVDSDHDDSSVHVFHFRQAGLTLPNRDYYLEDTKKMKVIRQAYNSFTHKVFSYFPELKGTADSFWNSLIQFETALATVSRSAADLRDVEKNYNKMTFSSLKETYSAIPWSTYANTLGWKADDKITVEQPEFFAFINESFTTMAIDDWKTYLKWRVVSRFLSKISERFAQLHFEFFGKVLSGTKEIMPLWKRVVLTAEGTIGDGVGQLYSEKHFPESSKQEVLELVEHVRNAYAQRIDTLDWMSTKTKTYAKKKLANIKVLIGYPDKWRDFSDLTIGKSSYIANILAAQKFEVAYWLKKLHQPTSRDEWFMTPQTVNAYHDPNRLVICFPAGILQAPFYDPTASYATNIGGIGTVIGHELTHGFDDQGCLFDAEGNVRTWQTKEERKAFTAKAQLIVDQADRFEVLPGLTLRGKLVLGESIADLGGIELALHALKQHIPKKDETHAIKEFFTAYAFTECHQVREEKLREFTLTDPHPASEFRVNGILPHNNDFYDAFSVASTDKLYLKPESRAKIW